MAQRISRGVAAAQALGISIVGKAREGGSRSDGMDSIVDQLNGAVAVSFRFDDEDAWGNLVATLDGNFKVLRCAAGGLVVQDRASKGPSYWSPALPMFRRNDSNGHILDERRANVLQIEMDCGSLRIEIEPPPVGWILDCILWRMDSPDLLGHLQDQNVVEASGYFLVGSHTRYHKPADLYRHLVHGSVYEDRYSWPHKRRICSENDAHGLYLILSGLEHRTGKRLYLLLKQQLLLAVLARQSEDGAFRHGEWTDGMESHFRLHCSAMHLMMDALAEHQDASVLAALARAAEYVANKFDSTAIGAWFYHDELECSEASMHRAPFKWWPSRTLGKSVQNMLVLNTQLDTLVALDRYRMLTGDDRYADRVRSGFSAVAAVLALRPQEFLYRLLFSAIKLTLLPTEEAARLPLWKRIWKRVGWQFFVPWLPRIKTRFPRLVMPGGYIDRELSLQTWAYDYLAVNLMDLVRAARGDREAFLMPYVDGILAFCTNTSIAKRWLEHPGKAYAVGFYAEALYLLALRGERPDVDAALANALVLALRHGLGLPPSINGGNLEAQPLPVDIIVPGPATETVVVANLSSPGQGVCLVVNCGENPVAIREGLCEIPPGWQIPIDILPPGGWVRIKGPV